MLLSKILTSAFVVNGVFSTPVEIVSPFSTSVKSGFVFTQTTTTDLEIAGTTPLQPRATPFWTQVGNGIFWTGIGAIAQGSAWVEMIKSCEEYSDDKKLSTGASCVFSVLTNVVNTAIFAVGSFHATISWKNVMYPPNNPTKRDSPEDFDWTSMWDSMSIEQRLQARAQWQGPTGLHLHRLDNGTSDIPNSITTYLSQDEDASAPHYRHVTNGTHGFVQPLVNMDTPVDSLVKRGDKFKWSKNIYGVKLSYEHPCIYEQMKPTDSVNSDLINTMYNMVKYMDSHPHSSWNMEWADQNTANQIMYGTLVVETTPFGKNYDSPNFIPQQSTCNNPSK